MFCVKCGNELKDGQAFCTVCGTKAIENAATKAMATNTATAVNATTVAQTAATASKSLIARIIVIVVGVLAAGGAAAWVLLGDNNILDMFGKKEAIVEEVEPPAEEIVVEKEVEVIPADEEEEEIAEEEIVYEIAESNIADYLNLQVADIEKYNIRTSEYPKFAFGYPASLFSSEYVSQDDNEGHYGIIKEEIHYSGSDGSFVNFMISQMQDDRHIDAVMADVYSFEHSFITDPVILVNETRSEQGSVTLRGYTDENRSTIVFIHNYIDDNYVMQMKLYIPEAADDEHRKAIEQYIQNMYELCEFGVVQIDDYINENAEAMRSSYGSNSAAIIEDDSVGYSEYGWSKAYFDYMQTKSAAGTDTDYEYAYLIYVNDDNIPELVLEGYYEAVGCDIVTYKNGRIDVLTTNRLQFDYIKRGNLLRNATSHMGYYVDNVYCIKNGRWKTLHQSDGDENTYKEDKYDAIFNEAYSNGTIGLDYDYRECFDTTLDYLLYIDE